MRLIEQTTVSFSRGVNDSATAAQVQPDEAAVMLNWRIAPDGTAELRSGSKRAHAAALNSGAVCYFITKRPFVTAAGVVQWVAIFGDTGYYSVDEGVTWTAITGATGLRQDYWSSATMRVGASNYLYLANGGANGYKWDGATWSTIANFPSGVKSIATFNSRLYATGHSGPIVQASRVADPETWSGNYAVTIQVQTHDGDAEVIGLFQIGGLLLAFKRNSTNYINGFGQTDIVVAAGATGLSRSVGLLGRRTVQAVGDAGCVWLSDRGLEFYGGGQIELASARTQGFFQSIAWGDIVATPNGPDAVFVPVRSEYRCVLPAYGGRNNYEVVYNSVTGGTTFFNHAASGTGTLYVEGNELTYSASNDRSLVRIVADEPFLTSGSEAGFNVAVASNEFSIVQSGADAACLFVADRGSTDNDAPGSGGYDGFVRYLDTGESDDVLSDGTGGSAIGGRLRPRALTGAPDYQFHEKWQREVEVQAIAPSATTITVASIAGGTEVGSQTLNVAASVGSQPRTVKARVTGRDAVLETEIRASKAGLKIAGIAQRAEIRRRRF